jgi:hypothetical protein
MTCVKFSACLNMSHHGLPHLFKDARVVAYSLADIQNAMVRCLFIVNRSYKHKRFWVGPTG